MPRAHGPGTWPAAASDHRSGRLDDVVVDRDDPWYFSHGLSSRVPLSRPQFRRLVSLYVAHRRGARTYPASMVPTYMLPALFSGWLQPCRCLRPDRSTVPPSAPVGSPWRWSATPFTNTRETPDRLRRQSQAVPGQVVDPPGRAAVDRRRGRRRPRRRSPPPRRPRSRRPNSRAGMSVMSWTARSSGTNLRPRSVSPRNRVGYGDPSMRSRWAPASDPPSSTSRTCPSKPRGVRPSPHPCRLVGRGHSTVRSSSAAVMSTRASAGSTPSSWAMSVDQPPLDRRFSGAMVSPMR